MASAFVVLSHGFDRCREMLKTNFARDWEWCQKHGLFYEASTRREVPVGYHLYWSKIAFVRRILPTLADGVEILWKDADTIVSNVDVSPRGVLPEDKDIGMRWITLASDINVQFWQAGVIFMRNTPALRELIELTWELRDHPGCNHTEIPPPEDEWALNLAIHKLKFAVHNLPFGWNAFRENEIPIIRAFHGWEHGRVVEKLTDEKAAATRRIKIAREA